MDRATELLKLLDEREQWEADQQAIAEFENWFVQKTIMEADAESIGTQE